ncbi:hypothetical protein BW723_05905 [Polaribacter reichenbachii]|uniref:Outer membrane protein beta-barrel domain-containing protein n=1 Tax=Polaribacter reichenbachii TaxID=996801 RepID=A0A1B8TYB6_9FLAO|nr:hypothetical protein [Polaribacter reichenbachii]APZ45856.1 hypothetical protein BW723_05905 [Polaribacter reichenbachii]AUC19718.1 hypothetical protein BTO17_13920 [Polaribacter reichenbachii]OBY64711.1 hypothetical protein LPB301_09815 [Polaribacter reichenbachii]
MKSLVFIVLLMIFSSINSQEKQDSLKVKQNPIVFGDFLLGYTNGSIKGLGVGFDINYQNKNNLYTFRAIHSINIKEVDFFIFIPVSSTYSVINEYSLLYGKRYVNDDFSYHFSGGLSYASHENTIENSRTSVDYVGFPMEVGVSWFKSKKKKFRVFYGLIPIGKPTGFGRSIGLKLYANIAKKSYVGLGLSFGLGWHKIYNENDK